MQQHTLWTVCTVMGTLQQETVLAYTHDVIISCNKVVFEIFIGQDKVTFHP